MPIPTPTIIRRNRMGVSIKITPKKELVILAPKIAPMWYINAVLRSKQDWITDTLRRMEERYGSINEKKFIDGEEFLYLGTPYKLQIVDLAAKPLDLTDTFILSSTHAHKARTLFETWYKKQAKQVIGERVAHVAERNDVTYERIRINNARSQWGSCSTDGNLSFTWRLIMAPIEAIDYVIAHELAHRHHMNHSQAFWKRVETLYPDYKRQRRWFRYHGHTLDL
jgi:hypothetical protein